MPSKTKDLIVKTAVMPIKYGRIVGMVTTHIRDGKLCNDGDAREVSVPKILWTDGAESYGNQVLWERAE